MPLYIAKQSTDARGTNLRDVIVSRKTGRTESMKLQNSFESTPSGAQELLNQLTLVRSRVKETMFAVEEIKINDKSSFRVIDEKTLQKMADAKRQLTGKKQD